jgi:hypothetical protein
MQGSGKLTVIEDGMFDGGLKEALSELWIKDEAILIHEIADVGG